MTNLDEQNSRNPRNPYPRPERRYFATLVDFFAIVAIIILTLRILEGLDLLTTTSRKWAILTPIFFYEALLTSTFATLGQYLFRFRVRRFHECDASISLQKINILQAYMRLFFKVVLGTFSCLTMIANPQRRALHDLMVGSVVLSQKQLEQLQLEPRTPQSGSEWMQSRDEVGLATQGSAHPRYLHVENLPDTRRLYSPVQVAGAALLGSPIAGCLLIAGNYRSLGDAAARTKALFWGATATVFLFALAMLLPDRFPGSLIPILYTGAIYQKVQALQGREFQEHLKRGGRRHSNWRVAGIGLATLVCVLVLVFTVLIGLDLAFPGLLPE